MFSDKVNLINIAALNSKDSLKIASTFVPKEIIVKQGDNINQEKEAKPELFICLYKMLEKQHK